MTTLKLEIKTSQVWMKFSTGSATHRWLMNLAPWNMLKISGFLVECQSDKGCLQYCSTVARWVLKCAIMTSVTVQKSTGRPQQISTSLQAGTTARDHVVCWLQDDQVYQTILHANIAPVISENQHFIRKQQNHKEGVRRNEQCANLCKKKKRWGEISVFYQRPNILLLQLLGGGEGRTALRWKTF